MSFGFVYVLPCQCLFSVAVVVAAVSVALIRIGSSPFREW